MKRGTIRPVEKCLRVLLSVLVVMILLFSPRAGAATYDDFAGSLIDTNKWTINGTGFSQSANV